ncbi:MAG: hypothetical protein JWM11_5615 [Planctomycetaceae bacterium]|nr:hypothetical protein [Planctomycetaceae bacterium]
MPLSFTCPCCRAHLKVRDESFVGQTIHCPECRVPLLVATAPTGETIARQVSTEKPAAAPEAKKQANLKGQQTSTKSSARRHSTSHETTPEELPFPTFPGSVGGSRTPQIVAWSVAAVCLLCLIPFLLPSGKSNLDTEEPQAPDAPLTGTTDPNIAAKKEQETAGKPLEKELPLPETPDGRLSALGQLLLEQAAKNGHFPTGTVDSGGLPAAQRWSWQAKIAAERDNPLAIPIDWGQRWNDPAADRFVRRPIPRFQNPLAETQTSEDKYPATHFVGIAGVGTDAPLLPVEHSRAGIFGQDRKTRIEDIRDGVSNTMLVAGIEQHPGSWAEGTSTYRAFTREPYIHGPDGFGTGQQKSMFVLMADGSFKEISSEIDPTVVRRMAAMNDGLPLDPECRASLPMHRQIPSRLENHPNPKERSTPLLRLPCSQPQ